MAAVEIEQGRQLLGEGMVGYRVAFDFDDGVLTVCDDLDELVLSQMRFPFMMMVVRRARLIIFP